MAQEQFIDAGIGKLGRLAETAVIRVISLGNFRRALGDDRLGKCFRGLRGLRHALQRAENLRDTLFDIQRTFPIGLIHSHEHPRKARHAATVFRREIGTAVKGLAIRRQKHGHRPTAAPGEHLHRAHINLIEIRALFPVDFNIDEQLVHQARDLFVLERLALHHMTPVTGGIADAQQDRFVFRLGLLERLLTPAIPIHRIMRVLQQIRTGLVNQPIGMFGVPLK